MKTLTASNQRVQFYLNFTTERPSTAAKRKRLEALKSTLEERDVMIDELFPNKRLAVLDHILFITSGAGIAKIGADKLSERCEVSVRTVMSAVKAIKETGEFIVARLIKTQGGAGKYIFVDKKHANFREIMREVFSMSDYKFAQLNAEQVAEQKNAETVEAVSVEGNKTSPNINIYSIKQEKDKYISDADIESVRNEVEEQPINNREQLSEYVSNPLQMAFYDVLTLLDYNPSINAVKGVLALRIGSNCDAKRFYEAKNAIHSIAMQINAGVQINNVVAAFTAILDKRMTYNVPEPQAEPTTSNRPVPFYNWLEEREQ